MGLSRFHTLTVFWELQEITHYCEQVLVTQEGQTHSGRSFLLSTHGAHSSLQYVLQAKIFLRESGFQTLPQCLTYLWHRHHYKQDQLDYLAPSKASQFICLDVKNLDSLVCSRFIGPSSYRRQAPWILDCQEPSCSHLSYPPPTTIVVLLFSGWVVSDSDATPWTVVCQAPLSMGFSTWRGWPFPSQSSLHGIIPTSPALSGCLRYLGSP